MHLGIDLDSVLANLTEAALHIHNYGRLSEKCVVEWDQWDMYQKLDMTKTEFHALMNKAWSHWEFMPLQEPDVALSMSRLRRNAVVSIITHRDISNHAHVALWLQHHSIPYDNLIFASGADKFPYPPSIFLDDHPRMASQAIAYLNKTLYLRDHPWNRNVDTASYHNVRRSLSLSHFVEQIAASLAGS